MKVYLLWHTHKLDEDHDDDKLIGVYSSEEKAQEARERAKLQPGFCDSPEGFLIDPYTVDEDHWMDGFVTEDTASAPP